MKLGRHPKKTRNLFLSPFSLNLIYENEEWKMKSKKKKKLASIDV